MYYIIITAVYATMMATYIPFIRIYTQGADINYVYPLFALLCTVNGFFFNIKTPYGMLTVAEGKYRESRIQISIQAGIEIVVSVVLAMKMGLNGIILGAVASNVYRDIDFIFFAPKHLIFYGFKDTLKMWVRSILLFAVLGASGYLFVSDQINGYLSWLIFAAIVFVVNMGVVLVVNYLCDKNGMLACISRIKKLRG